VARSWIREAAAVGLGAAMLLGVVVADGRPVVFADANIYYWMGELQLHGVRYALAPVLGGPASAADDPDNAEADDMRLRRTEMGARSAWYGLLFYLVTRAGGLWAFAALQAVVASYTVRALWRAAFGDAVVEHVAVIGLLAAATTLAFFVGFAMPDLWAGTGLAALGTLVFLPASLGRATKAALFLLVLAALTFHQSNALVAAPAIAAAALAARVFWRVPWRSLAPGLCLFLAALVCAVGLQAGYVAEVRAVTGDTPRSPPFLAARILADGPGRTYLRRSCAQGARWALCQFADLPLDDSQDILWSGDPDKGVFGFSDADLRIRIDREQLRFVAAAIASDPGGAAKAALLDAWRTLVSVKLEDPLRDPYVYLTDPGWKDSSISDLVHQLGSCGRDEHGCRPRFDPAPLAVWHGWVCIAALAVLAVAAIRRDPRRRAFDARLGPLIVLLLAACLINAVVTGVLSGPFARYQARIAWLPLMAALMAVRAAAFPRGPGGAVGLTARPARPAPAPPAARR
jgi:hypothetical protein